MEHFTGTKPVAASHAFDVAALQAYLQRELPGFAGPLTVEQFKGGQSNPTYLLTTPGAQYVMRSKPGPVAKLLPSAHAIEREFRVINALQGSDVPVARMHLLCEDESVIGRAFFVMAHVEGRIFWNPALPDSTPAERTALFSAIAAGYKRGDFIIADAKDADMAFGIGAPGLSPERHAERRF